MKLLFCAILSFTVLPSRAQSLIHITGTVIDLYTKKPVKDVSVDLKRDGSYIYNNHRWCLTDSLGQYDYVTNFILPRDSLVFNHIAYFTPTFSVEDSLIIRLQVRGSEYDSLATIMRCYRHLTKKQHRQAARKMKLRKLK